jgi:Protein tyrosine and serine/threonine kinase
LEEFDVGMCIVGLFDTKNVWWRTNTGFFTPGLTRKGTFCDELTHGQDHFIVTNAIEDPRFASHPSVMNRPFARFYVGVPLQSLGGHLLGTFAVVDFRVRDPPTTEQTKLLQKLGGRVVSALQKDVTGRALSADSFSALPSLWLDISTPEWKVVGVNREWESLTGVKCSDLDSFPGLFTVMATADDTEMEALRAAVTAATDELEKDAAVEGNAVGNGNGTTEKKKVSLQAILCPYDPSGADLQFVFAIKPAEHPPPITTGAAGSIGFPSRSLWLAEVHARVRVPSPEDPVEVVAATRISSEDYRPVRSSIGSGGKLPLNLTHGSSQYNSSGAAFRSADASGGHGGSGGTVDNNGSEELRIPARLSSLQLGQILGKGSYGSVYAGVLRGRPVAVKIIESISGPDQEAQQWEAQFEALLGIQRQHDNIVPTTDWIKEESTGQTWIVQELCDLGTLASLYKDNILMDMSTGKPDMLSVLETALDIARGMEYLHRFNVIHSDLSSNNVLLSSSSKDGRGFIAKVTDFGLSRISSKEVTTKTVGTVSHMPPELLVDGVITKAGDVYSYGVVLWEMWNGKRAWEGASMGQVVFAVTVKGHKMTLAEDAPPELAKLVDDCLQSDRNIRPDFSEIVKRLEKMQSDYLAANPQ